MGRVTQQLSVIIQNNLFKGNIIFKNTIVKRYLALAFISGFNFNNIHFSLVVNRTKRELCLCCPPKM